MKHFVWKLDAIPPKDVKHMKAYAKMIQARAFYFFQFV